MAYFSALAQAADVASDLDVCTATLPSYVASHFSASNISQQLLFLLQGQPNQPICLISHKQWNVQHIIIQLQVIQGKAHAKLNLIWKQLFEFLQAPAGCVGLRLHFNREKCHSPAGGENRLRKADYSGSNIAE